MYPNNVLRTKLMWTKYWLFTARNPKVFVKAVWFEVKMLRLVEFVVVGGLSAIVGLGMLYLLTDKAGVYYLVSYVIAFVASTIAWYFGHKWWTFKERRAELGLLKSFPTKLVVLGIEEGMLVLLVEVFGLWYMTSAVIAIAAGAPLSYLLSIKWIWNKVSTSKEET